MGLLKKYFVNCFLKDQEQWILWIPVLFSLGIIIYFLALGPLNHGSSYFSSLLFLFFCFAAIFFLKKNLRSLFIIAIAAIVIGFVWAKFYSEEIVYAPQIEHKIYATAIGKIDKISSYNNPINRKISQTLILKDLKLYKVGSLANDKWIKKKKITKKQTKTKASVKKIKKSNEKTKPRKSSSKKSKKKSSQKKSKQYQKSVIKNYLNYPDLQEINRELIARQNLFASDNKWHNNRYIEPPKKIIINNHNNSLANQTLNLGDLVMARVFLEPFEKTDSIASFNLARDSYFKGIGGTGFAVSDIKILKAKESKTNLTIEQIRNLRQKISQKIFNTITDHEIASIAVALSNGDQTMISKELNNNILNSGLAHLLSISGLHLAIATGIFFFGIRLILSLSQFLTLNFDIKKISAVIALIAGFFYLILVDMPIPAIRSFLMVGMVLAAILIDRTHNPLRSLAFVALIILIFNPYAVFLVSFQLSFAAILALITLYNFGQNQYFDLSSKPFFLKPIFYILGTVLASLAAEIAIAPFSIYHFNNFILYGILANMLAIPLTSFLIMPAIFLSLALMPFGLEKLILPIVSFGIELLIKICKFFSDLPLANISVSMISDLSLAIIIFSGLWFCLWRQSWRYLGILGVILGIFLAYKTPLPNLLIDGKSRYFAFYNQNDGLVFSKKIKLNKQNKNWLRKLATNEFRIIDQLPINKAKENFCRENFCQLNLKQKQILILTGRNQTDFICNDNWNILVNMSKKYQLPECVLQKKFSAKQIIDSEDLFNNGSYFVYL